METVRAKITGAGKFLPPKIVTNKDLEQIMNTTDEWIRQRTGIEERRWAEPGTTTASMGYQAALGALKNAGRKPQDVDAIIFATLSPDMFFPGGGVMVQRSLCPEKTIPALDVRNQCSGFLYSLSVADAWIRTGTYKCILVIGSEIHSSGLDQSPEGRDVGVLFGDGAGAVVLEPTTKDEGILTTKLHSEGEFAEKLWVHRPSSSDFPRVAKGTLNVDKSYFPEMDGRFVFKHAVTRMCEVLAEATSAIGKSVKDIDFVIAHQANLRINMMVMEHLGLSLEKTHNTLQKLGNTTAATLPLTFEDAQQKGLLKPGQLVAMVAFGSGFTWGATLMRL